MFKNITVKEQEYRLRLTLNCLVEFKALTGQGFIDAIERDNLDINELLVLFHLALKTSKSYENTLNQSGELAQEYIDEYNLGFEGFANMIGELVESALGKKKAK